MTNETKAFRSGPSTVSLRRGAIARKAGVYAAVMGRPEAIAYTDAARKVLGAGAAAMAQGEGVENYFRRLGLVVA